MLWLLLLAMIPDKDLAKKKPDNFSAVAQPRVLMPPPMQPPVRIVATWGGPLLEEEWCPGVEIRIDGEYYGSQQQDCPSLTDYLEQERVWQACEEAICVTPPGYECDKHCKAPFELTREWVWVSWSRYPGTNEHPLRLAFGPGRHDAVVTFNLPNNRQVMKIASFTVGGNAESQ